MNKHAFNIHSFCAYRFKTYSHSWGRKGLRYNLGFFDEDIIVSEASVCWQSKYKKKLQGIKQG